MIRVLALSILFLLLACGGGSGGGGDGGSDKGIRVMHGVIDSDPVSIFLETESGGEFLARASFAAASTYSSLPEDQQLIELFRQSNLSREVLEESITVDPDASYTYLYFGNTTDLGLRGNIILDAYPEDIEDGQAAVRIIHAYDGASAIDVQFGSTPIPTVSFGGASTYAMVDASGAVRIKVNRQFDQQQITNQRIIFEAGKVYTLLLTGEMGLFTKLQLILDR